MRRNISRRDTLSLLETIRRKVPGIALRTTFLVGHPGETEQDFDELKTFVRDFRFERMGVFAFSNEENTYAWKHYRDDVSPELKEMRVAELMELQQSISLEYNNSLINSTLSVIIDREESEFFVGRTEFDSPEVDGEVFIEKSDIIRIGRIYPVTITGAYEFDLMGKIKINNINIINTDNYGDEMYNY
jgi:ribosomal protein S12 methylthiotransferase